MCNFKGGTEKRAQCSVGTVVALKNFGDAPLFSSSVAKVPFIVHSSSLGTSQ